MSAAIRVSRSGGDSAKPEIYDSGSDHATLRLSNVPNEIRYAYPPELKSGYMIYRDALDTLDDVFSAYREKHGEEATKILRSEITEKLFQLDKDEKDHHTAFLADVNEIIDHFETLMISQFVEYMNDFAKAQQKAVTASAKNLKREIQQAINEQPRVAKKED